MGGQRKRKGGDRSSHHRGKRKRQRHHDHEQYEYDDDCSPDWEPNNSTSAQGQMSPSKDKGDISWVNDEVEVVSYSMEELGESKAMDSEDSGNSPMVTVKKKRKRRVKETDPEKIMANKIKRDTYIGVSGASVCPYCGLSYDKSKHPPRALYHHIKYAHEMPATHECEYPGCGKLFKRVAELDKHRVVHTREKNFECPIEGCGRRFTQPGSIKGHLMLHNGTKPTMTCEKCGKVLTSLYAYRRHLRRTHEAENPAPLRASFRIGTNPKKKKQIQEDDDVELLDEIQNKTYRCKYCSERFVLEKEFSQHFYENHSSAKYVLIEEYQCKTCKALFRSPQSLWRHRETIHMKRSGGLCAREVTNAVLKNILPSKSIVLKVNDQQYVVIQSEESEYAGKVANDVETDPLAVDQSQSSFQVEATDVESHIEDKSSQGSLMSILEQRLKSRMASIDTEPKPLQEKDSVQNIDEIFAEWTKEPRTSTNTEEELLKEIDLTTEVRTIGNEEELTISNKEEVHVVEVHEIIDEDDYEPIENFAAKSDEESVVDLADEIKEISPVTVEKAPLTILAAALRSNPPDIKPRIISITKPIINPMRVDVGPSPPPTLSTPTASINKANDIPSTSASKMYMAKSITSIPTSTATIKTNTAVGMTPKKSFGSASISIVIPIKSMARKLRLDAKSAKLCQAIRAMIERAMDSDDEEERTRGKATARTKKRKIPPKRVPSSKARAAPPRPSPKVATVVKPTATLQGTKSTGSTTALSSGLASGSAQLQKKMTTRSTLQTPVLCLKKLETQMKL